MKKFIRISCITAVAMLIVGFIMTTIAIAVGAPAQLIAMAKEGAFTVNGVNLVGKDFDYTYPAEFDKNYKIYNGDIEQKDIVEGNDISTIDLSIVCGKLTIESTSDSTIGIKSKNAEGFQYYEKNGTFYLKGFQKNFSSFKNEITLYLPEGKTFDMVNLSLGGGSVDMNSVLASNITADIGAGDFKCHGLTADSLSVDVGAGDCTLSNCSVQDADFSIGMGNTNYEGTISGNLSLECAMGEAILQLNDFFSDHNYDLECSMGSIHIGDRTYEDIVDESYIDHDRDSTYDIECSMGDVTLHFAED